VSIRGHARARNEVLNIKILLYEFVTSGGLVGDRHAQASESIRREGAAMMAALAADFSGLEGVEVLAMVDGSRLPLLADCQILPVSSPEEEFAVLSEYSHAADWTIVIAPEFDDLLRSRCRLVEESGGRLLGPSASLVSLAADKQRMAEHLSASGLPAPRGAAISVGGSFPVGIRFPVVIKPRFGAGSQDVRLVPDESAAALYLDQFTGPARVEEFSFGMAASVAFLCGPSGCMDLPPCRQRLSDDGAFRYLGGELPLEPLLAGRATELAAQAIATLPNPLGYLGVDLVLGDAPDGREDVVIEINPRLTTSYVGLRALARDNLAAAMLATAAGETPRLSFADRQLEFDLDGTIRDA
jgi:tyramine---L-glutamate ligase